MPGLEYSGEVRPAANVLASRYATPEIVGLFSDEMRVFGERQILIYTMEEQAAMGLPIPQEAIDDYKRVQSDINLDSIRERELRTKHDVNARNEEFNALAGHEHVMKGYTSRDLTETFEQYQIREALGIVHGRTIATLGRFAARAAEFATLPMAGRSHNTPAQPILLGKRFSNAGEEMLGVHRRLQELRDTYAWRGVKGPVGTQTDLLQLFSGDKEKVLEFEDRIARRMGFTAVLNSVGQVYPRSMDEEVVGILHRVASGASNMAKNVRLMAGHDLMTEGFQEGQVGSNAMPHKMNARTSERINGFEKVVAGHLDMISRVSGDQWNEGDVSCSVVRRVAIPDSFYATDGLLEATMTVLDNLGAYPAIIEREFNRYFPFLTSTKVLMKAVENGMGREEAHKLIKQHAIKVAREMREQGIVENDLYDRLDADERLLVTKDEILEVVSNPLELTGMADEQIANFVSDVEILVRENPEAAAYNPRPLL